MKNKTILVVDDDENIIELISFILNHEGYNVITASDGKDGLEKLKTGKPDLVICDVMMPKVDGYHFCWDILLEDGLYDFTTPKIVMLTARTDELDRGMSKKIGVDTYITKPFDPYIFADKIKSVLEQKNE